VSPGFTLELKRRISSAFICSLFANGLPVNPMMFA
jgi:hypothetical protein